MSYFHTFKSEGNTVEIFKNPSIEDLIKRTIHLRGIYKNGDIYVWDAYDTDHVDVYDELKSIFRGNKVIPFSIHNIRNKPKLDVIQSGSLGFRGISSNNKQYEENKKLVEGNKNIQKLMIKRIHESFKEFLNEDELEKSRWKEYLSNNEMLSGGVDIIKQISDEGYKAFLVGGAVRDIILGKNPHDIDIATNMPIEELQKTFPKNYDIGKSKDFGIFVVKHKGHDYEVAQFRKDGSYEATGRKPESIEIVQDFKTDAGRRDFTINAMAIDKDGNIIDYFDGKKDIKDKLIKTVGNPNDRFKEDNLRMLRAIRFSSKLGYDIHPETKEAIKTNKEGIKKISSERIREELMKMANQTGDKFAEAIKTLDEVGILKIILPEIVKMKEFEHGKQHPEGGVWEHTLEALKQNKVINPIINLSILLHDVGKIKAVWNNEKGKMDYYKHPEEGLELVDTIAERLKLSNNEKESIKFVVANHMKFHDVLGMKTSKILKLVKDKNYEILRASAYADAASRLHLFDKENWEKTLEKIAEIEEKWGKKVGNLISGERVMKLTGLKPSKKIGEIINKVTEYILQNDIKDEKEIDELIMKEYNGTK